MCPNTEEIQRARASGLHHRESAVRPRIGHDPPSEYQQSGHRYSLIVPPTGVRAILAVPRRKPSECTRLGTSVLAIPAREEYLCRVSNVEPARLALSGAGDVAEEPNSIYSSFSWGWKEADERDSERDRNRDCSRGIRNARFAVLPPFHDLQGSSGILVGI